MTFQSDIPGDGGHHCPVIVMSLWQRVSRPSERPWAHFAAWSGGRLVLVPRSGARSSCSEVPRYHRALTMASAWERKYYYSDLGKKVVLLPSLLLREEFKDIGYPMIFEGVLLLADVSGGLGVAEPPQT